MCACVRACVRACVCECVRVCVRGCVCVLLPSSSAFPNPFGVRFLRM